MLVDIKMMISRDTNGTNEKIACRSPISRGRSRRWRTSRTGTAVIAVTALLFATTGWLSLVFSGTTSRCWHRFRDWEENHLSGTLPWGKRFDRLGHIRPVKPSEPYQPLSPSRRPPPSASKIHEGRLHHRNRSLWENEELKLSLKHIVFGIAGSAQMWRRRKEFVRLWWRPEEMRGHVWLEEQIVPEEGDEFLPPIAVSEDTSRFRYTNPTGHPSGLRISRIAIECFRLKLPNVRWFVLGDDDTIFNAENLAVVLSKYDPSEMVYVGNPSESHSANSYFSHSMAFGGGGIAISYPLAEALSEIHDDCLERYPKLYGSDDRLHACITELGVPLSREPGFHQWDIRGSAHGLLSSHPVAPFVSVHHVEAVNPFFPGLSTLDSLRLFTKAMTADPRSFLQRAIYYDHASRLTFSISLGYVIQVFPGIVLPRDLDRSELTYMAWNGLSKPNEFDLDVRGTHSSVCKKPIFFFLKDIGKEGNTTLGMYSRASGNEDLKRKVFCFPRSPPLPNVQKLQVLGNPLNKNWYLAPRRLCCTANQDNNGLLVLTVGQCEKRFLSSVTGSL